MFDELTAVPVDERHLANTYEYADLANQEIGKLPIPLFAGDL
jgi:hypothetical protein